MSAFMGPDQAATEALLATDPDVSPWVQKYQRSRETVSQTDYEVSEIYDLQCICFIRCRELYPLENTMNFIADINLSVT